MSSEWVCSMLGLYTFIVIHYGEIRQRHYCVFGEVLFHNIIIIWNIKIDRNQTKLIKLLRIAYLYLKILIWIFNAWGNLFPFLNYVCLYYE